MEAILLFNWNCFADWRSVAVINYVEMVTEANEEKKEKMQHIEYGSHYAWLFTPD